MNNISADKGSTVNKGTVFKVCLGLLFALVFSFAGDSLNANPPTPVEYCAKITVDVSHDSGFRASGLLEFGSSVSRGVYDPSFVEAQLTVLQKTEILYPVIERLELTKAYAAPGKKISQQNAYMRLHSSMRLKNLYKPPGFIEIGICDTDPDRAANIATAITTVYFEKFKPDERPPFSGNC